MLISDFGVGAALPTESAMSKSLGASRTTIRAVLTELDQSQLISWNGRKKTVLRAPNEKDFFANEETLPTSERIETTFMEYILGGDLKPGAVLHEADLVRAFDTSTSVVRELLIRFSRFGLIEKKRNRHWVLRGFTRNFASELFDVREMFERHAFEAFLSAGPESADWAALFKLKAEHHRIADNIDSAYLDFSPLDEAFHLSWVAPFGNRFVDDFFGLVSIIFHYHYRWSKHGERERNLNAINQHLKIIEAVEQNDPTLAMQTFNLHLEAARATLMASVYWDASS